MVIHLLYDFSTSMIFKIIMIVSCFWCRVCSSVCDYAHLIIAGTYNENDLENSYPHCDLICSGHK